MACFSKRCLLTLVSALPLALALIVYWFPTIIDEWEAYFGYGNVQHYDLPPKVMEEFRMFDSNGDGYIDPYEFVGLQSYLQVYVDV